MDIKVTAEVMSVLLNKDAGVLNLFQSKLAPVQKTASGKTIESGSKAVENVKGSIEPEKEGLKFGIKNLYQVPNPNGRGRGMHWVSDFPSNLDNPVENAETARFALLVRNTICNDGLKPLQIHSVVVQSSALKKVLATVLKDYPGITPELERLTFEPPFAPFVHRWAQLEEAKAAEADPETQSHVELLYDILQGELRDVVRIRDDLLAHNVITFDKLWTIFQPGKLVFTVKDGQERVLKIISTKGEGVTTFKLFCESIDWDGTNFGRLPSEEVINSFVGTKQITKLPLYPFEFCQTQAKVRASLLSRGAVFERLRGYHYKAYKGTAFGAKLCNSGRYNVTGRIIIDASAFYRFEPDLAETLQPLEVPDAVESTDSEDDVSYCGDSDTEDGQRDDPKILPLTEEQLLTCVATVRGYSLKSKRWLSFLVNSITDIEWSDAAFESLVIPADSKELILGFAESQAKHKETFDDVIQGKGKGIIMLLHGPPGVGKTLTAESVAETMRVPLYTMGAGDLGLDPAGIEEALSDMMEMATRWNAVLLLDEADVFLEQRTLHDLERNKMVSIFLRVLEYYEGILFLTSNRVQTFDAAFQSRIHVSLEYPELTAKSRRQVWAKFLSSSPVASEISDKQLDKLAEMAMNGRQIKNVLKTAQLLASRKKSLLKYEHVASVVDITKQMG
ncbi:MAG: hypothetical protein M1825_002001 [Sarcosagium campestre]|nr:MAG: hypothetical protein M1825_002001 [Sarcosagium campestre]